MSKGVKLLLGVATLWPLLYLGLFVGWWLSMMLRMSSGHPWVPMQGPLGGMGLVFGLHCLTMAWVAGLLVVYIVDVFRNPRVRNEQKALWAVVLFLGNVFAMPVYWSLHVWPEPASGGPAPPSGA
ncbi:MAG TPA: hypothetical protein VMH40_21840 [Myxococcaceae bacterium]|nr:hypothetical protein [Myxococcaceae bacterium]